MSTWDAVVIGAGPAGASTLLLEKQSLPRYKAGGVPARTLRLLGGLDVSPLVESRVDSIDISRFGKLQFRKTSPRPLAWMVLRDRFDQFLTDLAAQAGAIVRDNAPVQAMRRNADRYKIETPTGSVQTYCVLAADGATGPTARWLGIDSAPTRSTAFEVEVAASTAALERWHSTANVDVGYRPWGYGWVFPKAGALSTGVVNAPHHGRTIRTQTERYLARLRLAEAEVLTTRGHPIRYQRSIAEPVARCCLATTPVWPTSHGRGHRLRGPLRPARRRRRARIGRPCSGVHTIGQPSDPARTRCGARDFPHLLLVRDNLDLARADRVAVRRLSVASVLPRHARRQHL